MPDLETTSISDYRLLDLVGQGQFAQVYCAIHRRTGQLVAIKQTRHAPENATQEPFILSELSSGAGHPNLVKCHAISQTDAGYGFVLDYCEGGTLRKAIGDGLSFLEAKSFIIDILQGLAYIHGRDIVHGDLKPENVLLTYGLVSSHSALGGHEATPLRVISPTHMAAADSLIAKIGDFGSARFTQFPNRSHREIGSPTYAAPERFNGQSSYASDLYSVGVMLYELLLDDRPFSGSPEALRQAHQTQPISLPTSLKPAVRQLLATALHKQPKERFANALAMLAALQQLSGLHSSPRTAPIQATVPALSISQALTAIPNADIAEPITRLIPLPQGCGVVTAKSFHLLTPAAELLPIVQFQNDVWFAVDPQGQWLIALPQQPCAQNQGLTQGQFYRLSKAAVGQAKALNSAYLNTPHAETVQVVAISSRYWLRIKTSPPFKTSLECFTRRGQFVGQLSFNLPIVDISLTAMPYQLIARTAAASSNTLLISLKPLQIRRFPHYSEIQQVSALPWGYIASGSGRSLVLDKSAELASILKDLPFASAIAPTSSFPKERPGDHQLVLAIPSTLPSPVNGLLSKPSSTSQPSSLFKVNLKNLDLGIIF